jgi:hypothetical protein
MSRRIMEDFWVWREYDAAAERCARRGIQGDAAAEWCAQRGDLDSRVIEAINEDPEAFATRVRETAYALAMERHGLEDQPNQPLPKALAVNKEQAPVKVYERIKEIIAVKGPGHRCDAACKRARHTYVHRFTRRAGVYGMPDGSLSVK